MKVISLLQPWATLVVIGAKLYETRSWKTEHNEEILIHASKKMTKAQKALCKTEPFKSALAGIDELPLGKIIGMVEIDSVHPTEEAGPIMYEDIRLYPQNTKGMKQTEIDDIWGLAADRETAFGDYSPGRFMWKLENPVAFTHHYPINGQLSIWNFDERICVGCGCSENDCRHCIELSGHGCYWSERYLCSVCDVIAELKKDLQQWTNEVEINKLSPFPYSEKETAEMTTVFIAKIEAQYSKHLKDPASIPEFAKFIKAHQ